MDTRRLVSGLKQRTRGIPHSLRELSHSLQYLAALRSLGWQQSVNRCCPLDEHGDPIPWYTYACLAWLKPRVKSSHSVFEFGAGYSTIWYAIHAGSVIAVDHNLEWIQRINRLTSHLNATLLHRTSATGNRASGEYSPYSQAIEEYPLEVFDIIAVDGVERVPCICAAAPHLRQTGIVVLDNSDLPAYRAGIAYLHSQGFRRIDFYGPIPQCGRAGCSSVFWRDDKTWNADNIPLTFQGWSQKDGPNGGWWK